MEHDIADPGSPGPPSGHRCVDCRTYGLPTNCVARGIEALYRCAEVDCVAFASQSSDGSETLFAGTAIRPVIVDWVACWISLQQVLLCALGRLHLNIQTAASADLDAAFAAICRVFNHRRVGASDVDVFRDRHSILPRCASE